MARGVNKVILLGNLGKDPDLRYTQSGNAVANFTLATTERRKQGEEWADQTEWHNIVVWGRRAELCNEHLQKGSHVYIDGRIQTRKWQDKDGNNRYTTEIVVNDIQFLGRTRPQGEAYDPEGYGDSAGGNGGEPGVMSPRFPEGFDPNDDLPPF